MQVAPLRKNIAFGLSSEQCEWLLAFELAGSLAGLAKLVGRDVSVVSRSLQKIAASAPVLEKSQGKWRLTRVGRDLNSWSRDAASSQQRVLKSKTELRIASTREFGARILAPGLPQLLGDAASGLQVSVITHEDGVERLLLAGQADIGFDCGRPEDASLRFRSICPERFVVIASPSFLKKHGVKRHEQLIDLPHLQYKRSSTTRMLQLTYEMPQIVATFNDNATIREATRAGLGWAVVPLYTVAAELKSGTLKCVPGWKIADERFGVWWLRDRPSLEPWVVRAVAWLSKQKLG